MPRRNPTEDDGAEATPRTIAEDLAEYLQETPDVCVDGSVNGWAWLRFVDGEWRAVQYSSDPDRLRSFVEGTVFDRSQALDWLVSNPAQPVPVTDAGSFTDGDASIWQDADEQDVWTDRDRCAWCGHSDRTRDLTLYETTENGECRLCEDCHESWGQQDLIVGPAGGVEA